MSTQRIEAVLLALLAGFALAAPAARAQYLELQSQTRTVGIQIDHHERHWESCWPDYLDPFCPGPDYIDTTSYSDGGVAPDAGPWTATASLGQFPDTFASQDSEITGRWIRASGSQRATSYYQAWTLFESPIVDIEEPHSSASLFSASFDVATTRFYRLTGSVLTERGGDFELEAESTAFIRLTGPGAEVVAEVEVSWPYWEDCNTWPDPECFTKGPESIAAQGELPPGSYTLEAGATGDARGYTKFSENSVAHGDFELELLLGPAEPAWAAVPALSASGSALLAIALGVLGSAWIARDRRHRVRGSEPRNRAGSRAGAASPKRPSRPAARTSSR